jgi:uncharacterized membrane-anchored protein YitT (DUF2179 family)
MNKHTFKDDFIAIITGTFFVALGLFFLQSANLITGGTAGLALLIAQLTSGSFGFIYFTLNIPFLILGWFRFGRQFVFNSVVSCAIVSIFVDNLHLFISVAHINPIFSGVAGGLLVGLGLLILIRHRSSLGGFNILCLSIQERFGIAMGKTQMALDCTILMLSFFFVTPWLLFVSVVGAIILNIVLAMNHKPHRYIVTYGS